MEELMCESFQYCLAHWIRGILIHNHSPPPPTLHTHTHTHTHTHSDKVLHHISADLNILHPECDGAHPHLLYCGHTNQCWLPPWEAGVPATLCCLQHCIMWVQSQRLASFSGLLWLQVLITCSMQKYCKTWSLERPATQKCSALFS